MIRHWVLSGEKYDYTALQGSCACRIYHGFRNFLPFDAGLTDAVVDAMGMDELVDCIAHNNLWHKLKRLPNLGKQSLDRIHQFKIDNGLDEKGRLGQALGKMGILWPKVKEAGLLETSGTGTATMKTEIQETVTYATAMNMVNADISTEHLREVLAIIERSEGLEKKVKDLEYKLRISEAVTENSKRAHEILLGTHNDKET